MIRDNVLGMTQGGNRFTTGFINVENLYRNVLMLILICLLTAIGLTPGDSSTVHIYTHTHNTQTNKMKQIIQNRTCITTTTDKHNNRTHNLQN